MNAASVDILVLKQVVNSLGRVFCTRDVSEHPRMIEAHSGLTSDSNYHGSVGKRLSQERGTLGIDELRKATSRGSRWEKRGLLTRTPDSESDKKTDQPAARAQPQEIGPQCAEDPPFKARMRLHQSWYRAKGLGVPCGTGPKPGSVGKFGNMLTRSDGATGLNFLTPAIAQCARERVAQGSGTVEPFRLFHNMLSSQPMCFNLFGPLVDAHALARRLLCAIVPEEVSEVTRVAMEWAPEPAQLYLNDRTAFDAFIEYRATSGRLFALAIETKLTEPFSRKEYDGEPYRRWMRTVNSPWLPASTSLVHSIEHNQLWQRSDHGAASASC